MPLIEVRHVNGSVEERELSRSQPLSVGRQSFNDVCIPDDDVASMHCRISWNKSAFEITSATGQGVDVNGVTVARATLKDGDIVRVGSVDLVFIDPHEETFAPAAIQNESPARSKKHREHTEEQIYRAAEPPDGVTRSRRAGKAEQLRPEDDSTSRKVEELSSFEGPVYTESQVLAAANLGELEDEHADSDHPQAATLLRSGASRAADTARTFKSDRSTNKLIGLSQSRNRPGEQDVFRSPLVLGLTVGGLVLLLVTGIFWFLIGREQASRLYDRAVAELNDGQYVQSITSFEQFLQKYSSHSLRRHAERGLDRALVQKEISGATPAWKHGLDQLQKLISNHRNDSDFADLHPILFKYAEEISLGSAKSAETARDAELLVVSDDARVILERYADPTTPPTGTLGRIKDAREAAERAIGKQNTFDGAMAAVETALANKQPIVALAEREKLVRRFPDYVGQKRVKAALQNALDLERSVTVTNETERVAETKDEPGYSPEPALGIFHTRSRTEDTSVGRVAYAMGKDSCYAVDTATGELVWRRVVGLESPFFPIVANGVQPSLLLYDSRGQSLIACQPNSGQLIWRQKLDGRPKSAPLVQEGQIYLATDDHSLCRIDLDSGRLTAKVIFSQNVLGPPALSHDGNHLLIVGEMAMLYSMSLRPLKVVSMTFTDHARGAVIAPPLSMGKLLLVCENDKASSSRLRIWDAEKPTEPLVELSGARVDGSVRDIPILRGNQLLIPSSNEHLAAFSVTDEAGRAGLAPIAQYRVRDGYGGAMFVALGPDRQFWSASSAFRRFEIGADSIRMDANASAPGIASQPLQLVGEYFHVGRKAPFHDATVFSAVDRERMQSPWRTVVGAELLEITPARGGGLVGVNEAGQIVQLSQSRLRQGGIDLKAVTETDLPPELSSPIRVTRLHDGRLTVEVDSEMPAIFIVNSSGQIEHTLRLAKNDDIQANPVLLDEGLVVSLKGKLKLIPLGAGKKSIQDWLAPRDDQPNREWRALVRLDGRELIACDTSGQLTRIQFRTTDVPHLAGVSKLQLDQPVDIAPVLRGESLFVSETSGTVKQLSGRSFDVDGKRSFTAPVRGLWSVGEQLLVWAGDDKLHAVSEGRELPERWAFTLGRRDLAGSPAEWFGQLWIACRDGTVVALDLATGKETRTVVIPQTLGLGLRVIGEDLVAVACDGTLYRIDARNQP